MDIDKWRKHSATLILIIMAAGPIVVPLAGAVIDNDKQINILKQRIKDMNSKLTELKQDQIRRLDRIENKLDKIITLNQR